MSTTTTTYLTQGQVEQELIRVAHRLEEATTNYADVAEHGADTEVHYRRAHAKATVALAASAEKLTVGERDAKAHLASDDEFAIWKLAEAAEGACKQAMYSLRAQLNALQTLHSGIRSQS